MKVADRGQCIGDGHEWWDSRDISEEDWSSFVIGECIGEIKGRKRMTTRFMAWNMLQLIEIEWEGGGEVLVMQNEFWFWLKKDIRHHWGLYSLTLHREVEWVGIWKIVACGHRENRENIPCEVCIVREGRVGSLRGPD